MESSQELKPEYQDHRLTSACALLCRVFIPIHLATISITAAQAGLAAIHNNDGLGMALQAQLGRRWILIVRCYQIVPFFIFLTLFPQYLLLMFAGFFRLYQAYVLHMGFYRIPYFRNEGRHKTSAGFKISALRIKHRFQFFNQKSYIAALAKHGRDHPCKCYNPLEMFHIFGVDEYLKGAAGFMVGPHIQYNIVDGDV